MLVSLKRAADWCAMMRVVSQVAWEWTLVTLYPSVVGSGISVDLKVGRWKMYRSRS